MPFIDAMKSRLVITEKKMMHCSLMKPDAEQKKWYNGKPVLSETDASRISVAIAFHLCPLSRIGNLTCTWKNVQSIILSKNATCIFNHFFQSSKKENSCNSGYSSFNNNS